MYEDSSSKSTEASDVNATNPGLPRLRDQGTGDVQSGCAFWARCEAQYPSLARMTFDVLLILSAECERVLSCSKIDRRAGMKGDIYPSLTRQDKN